MEICESTSFQKGGKDYTEDGDEESRGVLLSTGKRGAKSPCAPRCACLTLKPCRASHGPLLTSGPLLQRVRQLWATNSQGAMEQRTKTAFISSQTNQNDTWWAIAISPPDSRWVLMLQRGLAGRLLLNLSFSSAGAVPARHTTGWKEPPSWARRHHGTQPSAARLRRVKART